MKLETLLEQRRQLDDKMAAQESTIKINIEVVKQIDLKMKNLTTQSNRVKAAIERQNKELAEMQLRRNELSSEIENYKE